MLRCSTVLRSIELCLFDHLTVFLYRAGRNLFLCYPDEMESIAIVCLENFTVSAAWLGLAHLHSAILCCVVMCIDLSHTVQYSVLYSVYAVLRCAVLRCDVKSWSISCRILPTVLCFRPPISCHTLFHSLSLFHSLTLILCLSLSVCLM